MRRFIVALALAALLPGCASDCDKICGKLQFCFVSQGFDTDACHNRCENETAAQAGSGGGGGTAGTGGEGGTAGTGGAAGTGGEGGTGGTAGDDTTVVVVAVAPPTVSTCASCYTQLQCTGVLSGGCRTLCPDDLNP